MIATKSQHRMKPTDVPQSVKFLECAIDNCMRHMTKSAKIDDYKSVRKDARTIQELAKCLADELDAMEAGR